METAVHISGGISTHHQEHTQLYLQHLALVKPLLLPAAIVEELELAFHLFQDSLLHRYFHHDSSPFALYLSFIVYKYSVWMFFVKAEVLMMDSKYFVTLRVYNCHGYRKVSASCFPFFCQAAYLREHPCIYSPCSIFVVPSIMLYSSEISPTGRNNCVFILRNGFTLHVSGDNLTHHQEYICCIWPQVSRLT